MKKKATLLIKNIERVYTMKKKNDIIEVLHKAYIAIHHDTILACECGDHTPYIDSDTRMIDASNHIVVPAFIEPCAMVPKFPPFDCVRKEMECFMEYMRNGTLSIHLAKDVHPQHDKNYNYEIIHTTEEKKHYPILYGSEQLRNTKQLISPSFCISAGSDRYPVYNQLAYAQMLAIQADYDAMTLLKALTIHPARRLSLNHMGRIEKGKQADLLLLSYRDIEDLFHTIGNAKIVQIIKKGVRIYPFLLI